MTTVHKKNSSVWPMPEIPVDEMNMDAEVDAKATGCCDWICSAARRKHTLHPQSPFMLFWHSVRFVATFLSRDFMGSGLIFKIILQ